MGIATLGGMPLRIDPLSVSWDYRMRIAEKYTVGGKVIQVLGTQLSDMVVSGAFGAGDPARGDTMGWQEQERFRQQIRTWATSRGSSDTPIALRFMYPPRNWDFQVYVKALLDDIRQHNDEISPKFRLVLFVLDDSTKVVVKGIQDLYIQRLMDGVGWKATAYNGPGQADVDALLSGFGGSPTAYIRDQFAVAAGAQSTNSNLPQGGSGTTVTQAPMGEYSGAQMTIAGQIVAAGKALGINAQGQTIGLMVALGESTLTNIMHGDSTGSDSIGVFQQRASGWGSLADRTNPYIAATNFFKALLAVPGWQQMSLTAAGHAVQRNADPNYYARFQSNAQMILGKVG